MELENTCTFTEKNGCVSENTLKLNLGRMKLMKNRH